MPLKKDINMTNKIKMREDDRATHDSRESFSKEGLILPSHYYKGSLQTIDIIQDQLSDKGFIGFCKILLSKYLIRVEDCNNKDKLRSYTKAAYYLKELISRRSKNSEEVAEEKIRPTYYKKHQLEVVDFLEDQLEEEELIGGYVGIILKYILRAESKEGLADYKKAAYYLDRLINYVKEKVGEE